MTAKVAKGIGKRHLLKDDSEPLKEMQNISSPVERSLKSIKQEKIYCCRFVFVMLWVVLTLCRVMLVCVK